MLALTERQPVGALDGFEQGLERFITGLFNRTFKSQLQPVEIASAIKHEMDTKAAILTRDRILVPNRYTVRLGNSDFKRLQAMGDTILIELRHMVEQHAKKQGFQFAGVLDLNLVEDSSLGIGALAVSSVAEKLEVAWSPLIECGDQKFYLTRPRTTIGRDESADIQIPDSGLSRKHFELIWDGERTAIRDLGSTNGTRVNGKLVTQLTLHPDSVIQAGRSEFIYRIVARPANTLVTE